MKKEYTKQLKMYCYLYYRKIGRLPTKASVYYLKYNGSKGELSFTPTMEDVKEAEEWHLNARAGMEALRSKNKVPPVIKDCFMFCPFENICAVDNPKLAKFNLHIKGNYVFIDGPITNIIHKALEKKFSYELKNAHWIKKSTTKYEYYN